MRLPQKGEDFRVIYEQPVYEDAIKHAERRQDLYQALSSFIRTSLAEQGQQGRQSVVKTDQGRGLIIVTLNARGFAPVAAHYITKRIVEHLVNHVGGDEGGIFRAVQQYRLSEEYVALILDLRPENPKHWYCVGSLVARTV